MVIELREWETVDGLRLSADTVHAMAGTNAFMIRPDRTSVGRWSVAAQRYVGLVTVGDVQFRITPKIPVFRLAELLCEAMDLVDWRPEVAAWAESDDLLEVIAASFVAHAERALLLGLIQGYRTTEEDLYSIRGRVDFGRLAGRPSEVPLPVAVTYDDFMTNVLENQLLAGAAMVLLRFRTLPTELQARLRRLEFRLMDVLPTPTSSEPPSVTWSRLNERYRAAVTLSRIVLRSAALDHEGQAGIIGTSFLVDMDKLFETVVGHGIKRALAGSGLEVKLQNTDRFDADGHLQIRPDILVSDGKRIISVADIKYKMEISNHDVYQVLAYAHRYGLDRSFLLAAARQSAHRLEVSNSQVDMLHMNLNQSASDREMMYGRVAAELVGSGSLVMHGIATPSEYGRPNF